MCKSLLVTCGRLAPQSSTSYKANFLFSNSKPLYDSTIFDKHFRLKKLRNIVRSVFEGSWFKICRSKLIPNQSSEPRKYLKNIFENFKQNLCYRQHEIDKLHHIGPDNLMFILTPWPLCIRKQTVHDKPKSL